MRRCSLVDRYARWAGLERQEPRWGWRWMVGLHLLVSFSALAWVIAILWLFARLVG